MRNGEEKLIKFILNNKINAEHIIFQEICHTVDEAARAANVTAEDFVKNVCLVDDEGKLIVAIVKGEDKVSNSKIGKLLNIKTPKTAAPSEILNKTGYICGGVPSFGFDAVFLIDQRVFEKEIVYTGGGSEFSLVRVSPNEILAANNGQVADIRK